MKFRTAMDLLDTAHCRKKYEFLYVGGSFLAALSKRVRYASREEQIRFQILKRR